MAKKKYNDGIVWGLLDRLIAVRGVGTALDLESLAGENLSLLDLRPESFSALVVGFGAGTCLYVDLTRVLRNDECPNGRCLIAGDRIALQCFPNLIGERRVGQ